MNDKEFIELLKKLRERRLESLEALYCEYFPRLCNSAYFILKNRQDAYDAAMNVILKLTNFDGDPNKITRHKGWLATIIRNEAVDIWRKRRRTVSDEGLELKSSEMADSLWLTDICAVLTEEEKEIFTAKFIWDKTLKEFAAENNMPYIRVKRIYLEIKQKIRELYM